MDETTPLDPDDPAVLAFAKSVAPLETTDSDVTAFAKALAASYERYVFKEMLSASSSISSASSIPDTRIVKYPESPSVGASYTIGGIKFISPRTLTEAEHKLVLEATESVFKVKSVTPTTMTTESEVLVPEASKVKRNKALWKSYRAFVDTPTFRVGYVWGPPGVGKTYGAQRWGLKNKKGSKSVYCITLTEETPSTELRGHFIPKGGEFVWHDGPLSKAMREGARVVINEISHASPDCLSFFYVALESPETAVVSLPTGEELRPAEGFQVILTDNLPPSQLPAPLFDRLDASFEVIGPSTEAINSFPETFQNVVLQTALENNDKRISLRSWETIARLTDGGMDVEDAGATVLRERWNNVKTSVLASKVFESKDTTKKSSK